MRECYVRLVRCDEKIKRKKKTSEDILLLQFHNNYLVNEDKKIIKFWTNLIKRRIKSERSYSVRNKSIEKYYSKTKDVW